MSNIEIIKLLAERSPELLGEFLDSVYNCGLQSNQQTFDIDWLESSYDRFFFRELDIEDLM